MNTIIKIGLGLAGIPDPLIAEIESEVPGATMLIANAKKLKPILDRAQPHVAALTPLVQQGKPHALALFDLVEDAWPILQAAYPELMALLPTAERILALPSVKGS